MIEKVRRTQLISPVLVAFSAVLLTSVVLLAIDSFLDAKRLLFMYLLPTVVIAMHYGSMLAVLTIIRKRFGSGVLYLSSEIQLLHRRYAQRRGVGIFSAAGGDREQGVAAITHDVRAPR